MPARTLEQERVMVRTIQPGNGLEFAPLAAALFHEAAAPPIPRAGGGRDAGAKRANRVECSKIAFEFRFRTPLSETELVRRKMKMPVFARRLVCLVLGSRLVGALASQTGRKPDECVERSKIAIKLLHGKGLEKRSWFDERRNSSGFVRFFD